MCVLHQKLMTANCCGQAQNWAGFDNRAKCHKQSGFPLQAVALETQKQDLAVPEDIIRRVVVYAGPALVGPRQRGGGWGG